MFLVVLQGALGDDLGIISSVASFYLRSVFFVLGSYGSLGPFRSAGPVL